MKATLLSFICCPVCREDLRLDVIHRDQENIEAAILTCTACSKLFPVVAGVPRLLPNAINDFYGFFKQYRSRISPEVWENNYRDENRKALEKMLKKQKCTQKSFSLEWSFQGKETVTWRFTPEERAQRVVHQALQLTEAACRDKVFLDAGCGNGLLTEELGNYFSTVVGIDLSYSVEQAHRRNTRSNVHFIQGDLMHPPLKFGAFDIIFSSGVLHHTPNTELTFSCLTPLLKPGGRFYMWLYHPIKSFHHQMMLRLRKIFYRLPLKFNAYFFLITFVPFALAKRKLKNMFSRNKTVELPWRVQLINFIDGLTPRYRYEHTPEEVSVWYRKRNFHNITVTIRDHFGFGIFGDLRKNESLSEKRL